MRKMLPFVLLVVAATAGCLDGDDGETGGEETETNTAAPEPTLPDDIEDSQMVSGVTIEQDTGEPICSLPSEQCVEYPFTVGSAKVTLDASLTWTLPASDFDLYLLKADGTEVISAVDPPGETEETFKTSIGKGDYVLYVVPYTVAADTYTLTATFS